jgi:hypothetical protein
VRETVDKKEEDGDSNTLATQVDRTVPPATVSPSNTSLPSKTTKQTPAPSIADSGASSHFFTTNAPLLNKQPADRPIAAHCPNGTIMCSTHTGELDTPSLPVAARQGHVTPELSSQSLLSMGQLCPAARHRELRSACLHEPSSRNSNCFDCPRDDDDDDTDDDAIATADDSASETLHAQPKALRSNAAPTGEGVLIPVPRAGQASHATYACALSRSLE